MKILLVDDEEKFVSRLSQRLIIRGFDSQWVTTCESAINKVLRNRYDVVVLDVKMPYMSGLELKKKLEKLKPDMKFIFVTGHGSDQDYEHGCREGLCTIVKPFKIETLVDQINLAMQGESQV